MATTNNNRPGVDLPNWEQLYSAPANSAAGAAMVDDGYRFIYYVLSATSFWRYDTWADTWQPLANLPGGTLAAGSALRYVAEMGAQANGQIYGSVYAFISTGTAVTFYRYDIESNAWSTLSVTGVAAAFTIDGRLICPEPALNGNEGGYHSAGLVTVTLTADVAAGATSLPVSALSRALPVGAVLNFGTPSAPLWAVLTVAAAAAATSLTVSALIAPITTGLSAFWYADMFLLGGNAMTVYRYNIAANTWSTTSANAGNPTLTAVPSTAPAAGMTVAWLPGAYHATLNPLARGNLILVRGGNSAAITEYNLDANNWTSLVYRPFTEMFSTGSASGVRQNAAGKADKLLLQASITGKFYELLRGVNRLDPKVTQFLVASGTALVGDRASVLKSPDGQEWLYFIPSTSAYFFRTPLFF